MKKNTVFTLIITIALLASNLSMVFADDSSTPELPQATNEVIEDSSTEAEEIFQENENTEAVNFTTSELPENWETGGQAELTGNDQIDPEGDGWLRLTGKSTYEMGYAVYDKALSTENGLAFQFDYTSWGGSGADGIAFFLMDGETSMEEFNAGGEGGSLGYAPRHQVDEGLSNAVIGIGLDEFGNFSAAGEGRIGGQGRTQDSVSIRGAGDGFKGYEFVDGTKRLVDGIDIRNTNVRPDQAGKDYRNVLIIFTPIEQQFSLTLNLQFGAEKDPQTLFSDLILPGVVPATIKFGFTATSGGSTNFHEIRNLIIDKAVINDVQEVIQEEEQEEQEEEQDTAEHSQSKRTVSVPVTAVQTGNTLTIIPVTASTPYPLSCRATSILDIQDQVFAILPALCDHQALLALEEIEIKNFNLPEQYAVINAASLSLVDSSNTDATVASGDQIEVGFYIDNEIDPHSLTILMWESGQFVELEVEIENGVISTKVTEGGFFILVQK